MSVKGLSEDAKFTITVFYRCSVECSDDENIFGCRLFPAKNCDCETPIGLWITENALRNNVFLSGGRCYSVNTDDYFDSSVFCGKIYDGSIINHVPGTGYDTCQAGVQESLR